MKLPKVPAGVICKITQFPSTTTNSGRVTLLLLLIILEASIREQSPITKKNVLYPISDVEGLVLTPVGSRFCWCGGGAAGEKPVGHNDQTSTNMSP